MLKSYIMSVPLYSTGLRSTCTRYGLSRLSTYIGSVSNRRLAYSVCRSLLVEVLVLAPVLHTLTLYLYTLQSPDLIISDITTNWLAYWYSSNAYGVQSTFNCARKTWYLHMQPRVTFANLTANLGSHLQPLISGLFDGSQSRAPTWTAIPDSGCERLVALANSANQTNHVRVQTV